MDQAVAGCKDRSSPVAAGSSQWVDDLAKARGDYNAAKGAVEAKYPGAAVRGGDNDAIWANARLNDAETLKKFLEDALTFNATNRNTKEREQERAFIISLIEELAKEVQELVEKPVPPDPVPTNPSLQRFRRRPTSRRNYPRRPIRRPPAIRRTAASPPARRSSSAGRCSRSIASSPAGAPTSARSFLGGQRLRGHDADQPGSGRGHDLSGTGEGRQAEGVLPGGVPEAEVDRDPFRRERDVVHGSRLPGRWSRLRSV